MFIPGLSARPTVGSGRTTIRRSSEPFDGEVIDGGQVAIARGDRFAVGESGRRDDGIGRPQVRLVVAGQMVPLEPSCTASDIPVKRDD